VRCLLCVAALGGLVAFATPLLASAATPAPHEPSPAGEGSANKGAPSPNASAATPRPPTEGPGEKVVPKPKPDPDEGIARGPAEDLRSGHFVLAVAGVVLAPSAHVLGAGPDVGAPTVGGGLRGMIGVGVSQHVVLRVDGGGGWLGGSSLCDQCTAASYDVGIGVDYHLAQGIAFDPWIGIGMGYRYGHAAIELPAPAGGERVDGSSGIDIVRIALGGDFYPLSLLGFGPFIETDVGVQVDPATKAYGVFLAGLRISLDPMATGTEIEPAVARR
jgi:hypothetical protein